jgi:hypothetical protein
LPIDLLQRNKAGIFGSEQEYAEIIRRDITVRASKKISGPAFGRA